MNWLLQTVALGKIICIFHSLHPLAVNFVSNSAKQYLRLYILPVTNATGNGHPLYPWGWHKGGESGDGIGGRVDIWKQKVVVGREGGGRGIGATCRRADGLKVVSYSQVGS